MRRVLLATAAMCALAACSQDRSETARTETAPAAPSPAQSESTAAAPTSAADAANRAAPPPAQVAAPEGREIAQAPEAPELAYSYRYGLEAPEDRVAGLLRRHERACVVAGPQICQLMAAETAVDEDSGKTSGELTLRAVPAWVEDFRDRLEADAAEADGRLTTSASSTDDLTRVIGDGQAEIVRLTGERDRLRRELNAWRGGIEGRLEIERDLEAAEAALTSTAQGVRSEQARITMSTVQVRYIAAEGAIGRGAFAPVASAASDFTETVMMVLGALIRVASVLLIPGLVIGGIWAGVAWLRRRGRKHVSPAQAA